MSPCEIYCSPPVSQTVRSMRFVVSAHLVKMIVCPPYPCESSHNEAARASHAHQIEDHARICEAVQAWCPTILDSRLSNLSSFSNSKLVAMNFKDSKNAYLLSGPTSAHFFYF